MSDSSDLAHSERQIALAIAALGASFAQVLCEAEPSLHRRLIDAARRNGHLLDAHGEDLASDILGAFIRALHDQELFPAVVADQPERSRSQDSPRKLRGE